MTETPHGLSLVHGTSTVERERREWERSLRWAPASGGDRPISIAPARRKAHAKSSSDNRGYPTLVEATVIAGIVCPTHGSRRPHVRASRLKRRHDGSRRPARYAAWPEGVHMRKNATARLTTYPNTPAPQCFCPVCGRPLAYRQTVDNGVSPIERWDLYECRTCGPFEYRDRTRRLRSTLVAESRTVA